MRSCSLCLEGSGRSVSSFEKMELDGQNLLLKAKDSLSQYSVHLSTAEELNQLKLMIAFCLKRHNKYVKSQEGKEIPMLEFPIKS